MSGEVISLNVGGVIFVTSVATLTKYPASMLAAMFNPESERPPARKDGQGNFFIDRDPKPFEVILSFLRRAKLRDDMGGCTLEHLEGEADYFGLDELLKVIGERRKAEAKMKKAEEKKEKDRKKAEEEKEQKRKNEEEEKEKKRPKMSPLEYETEAAKMREKWVEASQMQLKIEQSCDHKCGTVGAPKCVYCTATQKSCYSWFNLATQYEKKAADLRLQGYEN